MLSWGWAWQLTPLIQEAGAGGSICKFQVSLVYMENSRKMGATHETMSGKTKTILKREIRGIIQTINKQTNLDSGAIASYKE